jgi:hypothetical protein
LPQAPGRAADSSAAEDRPRIGGANARRIRT